MDSLRSVPYSSLRFSTIAKAEKKVMEGRKVGAMIDVASEFYNEGYSEEEAIAEAKVIVDEIQRDGGGY